MEPTNGWTERRKDGWTWTKEIIGTIVGVVMVMAIPSGWLFQTIQGILMTQATQSMQITHLQSQQASVDSRQSSQDAKLDRILEQITAIKISAAEERASQRIIIRGRTP